MPISHLSNTFFRPSKMKLVQTKRIEFSLIWNQTKGSLENPGREISSSIELYADEKEFMIISINDDPEVGEVYHVKIEFRNSIKKIESGFYESSFVDEVFHQLISYTFIKNLGWRDTLSCNNTISTNWSTSSISLFRWT